VFGAGGDRDAGRRADMGSIASYFADHMILTSDNPRSEKASTIVMDIIGGTTAYDAHKTTIELDRKKAIEQAYGLSNENSIIALLGKGCSEYQIIGNEKIRFSEREIISSFQNG
jgi:UDP-N-acetylmuramoyl-L-alanyl-D-glutamate--2,6-diaminopimelate ligase